MEKVNTKLFIITSLIILAPIFFGVAYWDTLPDIMGVHWGIQGNVDGFSDKSFAVFGMPLFLFVIQLISILAVICEPKRKEQSEKILAFSMWIIPIVSFFISFVIYANALGHTLDVSRLIMFLMGFMFLVIGGYLPKCPQSYTMGIKIPWTLDDEDNWIATHAVAGPVWMIVGALIIICSFFKIYLAVSALVLAAVFIPTIYSYNFYKRMKDEKH